MLDETLREILSRQPNPVEALASREEQMKIHSGWFADIATQATHFLTTGTRITVLKCGHFVLSKALHRAACPRCGEMIRSGYDYQGFRKLGMPDEFNWPGDPLRELNQGGRDEA